MMIFSNIKYCARVNQRHFFYEGGAGGVGCDSRHHSTTGYRENVVVVAEISYHMLEVLSFCDRQRA